MGRRLLSAMILTLTTLLSSGPALGASRQDMADLIAKIKRDGQEIPSNIPGAKVHTLRQGKVKIGGKTYDQVTIGYVSNTGSSPDLVATYLIDKRLGRQGVEMRVIYDGARGALDGDPDGSLKEEICGDQLIDLAANAAVGNAPTYTGEIGEENGRDTLDFEEVVQRTLHPEDFE